MTRLQRRAAWVLALSPLLLAATPDRELNLQVPAFRSDLPVPSSLLSKVPPARYQPAPLPNRDVQLLQPRANNAPTFAPSLFSRPDQYRGDGFNKGSTAQNEQEKRVHPGAGFSLHLPLTSD